MAVTILTYRSRGISKKRVNRGGHTQKEESCDQAEGQGAWGQQTAEDAGQKDLQPLGDQRKSCLRTEQWESAERRKETEVAGWEKEQ